MNRLFNSAWSNPSFRGRIDIVFINRFKDYGAYDLRTSYAKTTARAFIITVCITSFLVAVPLLVKKINHSSGILSKPNHEEVFYLIEPPVIVPVILPVTSPPIIESEKTLQPSGLTTPIVIDEQALTGQQPPLDLQDNANPESETQIGTTGLPDQIGTDAITETEANRIHTYVPEMPVFPGGDAEMYKFMKSRLRYPEDAISHKITGKVHIAFVVDSKGDIKDARILSRIGYGCDEEALRVIRSMPAWIPGKVNGRAVSVSFTMPVEFVLR